MKRPPLRNQLRRSFYDRPTELVARELLGKVLLRRIDGSWVGGRIVETEAYLAEGDPACHAARGKTPSNASMFGAAGTLYVYPIHAKYCMNAVTEASGRGSAVLIRAVEPLWGIEFMRARRGLEAIGRLTRGPAMLCQALQVDRKHDGTDLIRDRDFAVVASGSDDRLDIVATPRVGISSAQEALLRFVIRDNAFLSRKPRG